MTYNKLNSILKTNTEINYITDHDLKDRFPTYFEDVIKNT